MFINGVIIVISRILRVFESSRHELDNKDLQNKQGIDGGVLIDSLMLKLDKEIESVNVSLSVVYFLHTFCCHSFLIYKGGG